MGIRTVINGRVKKAMRKGLQLTAGGQSWSFENEDEVCAFLKRNAQVSSATLGKLKDFSLSRLEREYANAARLYKAALSQLLQVSENSKPLDLVWREIDINVLPDEQSWPDLLFAVSSHAALSEASKHEALERFVEFLRARKGVLARLLGLAGAATVGEPADTREIEAAIAGGEAWAVPAGGTHDVTDADRTRSRDYRRMPSQCEVSLRLGPEDDAPVYLSRWKLLIRVSGGEAFLDDDGARMPLKPGRNTIGRSSQCDIVLTGAPMDVSRLHLVIDWKGGGEFLLHDESSKGTWIPREYLPE